VAEIGEQVLEHLIKVREFSKAAHWCPLVLGEDRKTWTNWVCTFIQHRQVAAIAPYIPTKRPQLPSTVYEMVLNFFLQDDPERFLQTLRQWRQGAGGHEGEPLFGTQTIIFAVLERQKFVGQDQAELLQNALGELYMSAQQYDQALHVFLGLGKGEVFELIQRHQLFDSIREKVLMLVQFDADQAVELLVNNTARVPVEAVVTQLRSLPALQLQYLHALFLQDPMLTAPFHDLQVELYAQYEPGSLFPLLHASQHYSLEHAHRVCHDRGLFKEAVFLTARMGNHREALSLILTEMKNIEEAIRFVQSQKDDELWELLVDHSVSRPEYVGGILDVLANTGIVDPVKLLRRIPQGMDIPHLSEKLLAIVQSYRGMESLHLSCRKLLDSEVVVQADVFHRKHRRARRMPKTAHCKICQLPLEDGGMGRGLQGHQGVVLFFNGNGYHKDCLPLPANLPPGREGSVFLEEQMLDLRDPNLQQSADTRYLE